MNKKKLPRAVTQTAEDMRRSATEENIDKIVAPSVKSIKSTLDNAELRRSRANTIIERYANLAVLGGAIPLPLINVAGVTVLILRMVKLLCDVYNIPYERGRARAVAVGLVGGAVPTTASTVTASTLVYFTPGANMIGLAVSSVSASICTRTIGRRFIEHFETGATLFDFPVIDRR